MTTTDQQRAALVCLAKAILPGRLEDAQWAADIIAADQKPKAPTIKRRKV